MSSLTVGTLNVSDKLIIPRLTAAQIAGLTPEEGLIVYDTDSNFIQVYVNGVWVESNVGTGNQLYDFTTHTFVSGVPRGEREGPGFSTLYSLYSSATWKDDYFQVGTSFPGYQRWTVPATATYLIEAGGARGGRHPSYGITDIWGAKIRGFFDLQQGDELDIVVGAGGNQYSDPHGNEAGGGGASFVRNVSTNTVLIVAGGGGGSAGSPYSGSCSKNINDAYGQVTNTTPATTCQGNYTTSTPTQGFGGWTNGPYSGQGGAGFFGDSAGEPTPWHCGAGPFPKARALDSGATGSTGSQCYTSQGTGNRGGFGGGGGGNLGGPGGGGGYTGGCASGAWSSYAQHGGGGGSYNAGSNQTNTRGGHTGTEGGVYAGSGYVKITKQ